MIYKLKARKDISVVSNSDEENRKIEICRQSQEYNCDGTSSIRRSELSSMKHRQSKEARELLSDIQRVTKDLGG